MATVPAMMFANEQVEVRPALRRVTTRRGFVRSPVLLGWRSSDKSNLGTFVALGDQGHVCVIVCVLKSRSVLIFDVIQRITRAIGGCRGLRVCEVSGTKNSRHVQRRLERPQLFTRIGVVWLLEIYCSRRIRRGRTRRRVLSICAIIGHVVLRNSIRWWRI